MKTPNREPVKGPAAAAAHAAKAAARAARDKVKAKDGARDKAPAAAEVKVKEYAKNKRRCTMPGFDRSGPLGEGPMTGGKRGLCGSARKVGYSAYAGRGFCYGFPRGRGFGRGVGLGRGRGFAWRSASAAPVIPTTPDEEMDILKDNIDILKQQLDAYTQRLDELTKTSTP